ncbi:MAG: 50S ribosomal protein L21 [Candidatus Binatia bacterium]|nr:MAG: 50S ribosomal protein L21 [Candidatus Binatia bacterium]
MEYAVIRTGGKQYRVEPGEVLRIEKLEAEPGTDVEFSEVLVASDENGLKIGQPTIPGAKVVARVVRQGKAKKILVFKKKRRKNYRRRYGHRQPFTEIRVTSIQVGA